MNEAKLKKLRERANKAKSRMELARSRWVDAYDYCLPQMDDAFGTDTESQDKGFELYDDTAVQSAPEMASKMLDLVWPLFSEGWAFEPAGGVSEEDKAEAREALLEPTQQVHNLIAASNLREVVEQSFLDYMITTAQVNIAEGPAMEPLRGTSVSPWQQWFERLPTGQIVGFYRERKMTPRSIKATWKPDDLMLPEELKREDAQDKEVTVVECTTRIDDLWNDVEEWETCVMVETTGDKRSCIYQQSDKGFGSCPTVAFGWGRRNTNWWHWGPCMQVLPSVITLNTATEFILEHADVAIGGIWTMPVTNGVNVDNIRLQAGTIIPHRADTGPPQQIGNGGNMQVGFLLEQQLSEKVRDGLLAEDFRGRGETPVSSREIAARQARLAQRTSSPFSRLWNEFLIPFVGRAVYIGRKRGMVDLPDDWAMGMNLLPKSPQARQYRMEDASQTIDWVGALNNMFGPGRVQMMVDSDAIAADMAWYYEQKPSYLRTMDQQRSAMESLGQMSGLMDESGGGPDAAAGGAMIQ